MHVFLFVQLIPGYPEIYDRGVCLIAVWILSANLAAIRPGWKNRLQRVGSGFLADNNDIMREIDVRCHLRMRLFRTCDVCALCA